MKLRPLNIIQNVAFVGLMVGVALAITRGRYDEASFCVLLVIMMLLADIGSRLPKGPSK